MSDFGQTQRCQFLDPHSMPRAIPESAQCLISHLWYVGTKIWHSDHLTRLSDRNSLYLKIVWPMSDPKKALFSTKSDLTKNLDSNFSRFFNMLEPTYVPGTKKKPHMLTTSNLKDTCSQTWSDNCQNPMVWPVNTWLDTRSEMPIRGTACGGCGGWRGHGAASTGTLRESRCC